MGVSASKMTPVAGGLDLVPTGTSAAQATAAGISAARTPQPDRCDDRDQQREDDESPLGADQGMVTIAETGADQRAGGRKRVSRPASWPACSTSELSIAVGAPGETAPKIITGIANGTRTPAGDPAQTPTEFVKASTEAPRT